jgi:energy-converting hydrogenase Eha subunit A
MENKTSASKSGLQYALLFGVIMILEFIIGYVMNIDPQTNKVFGVVISVLNYLILPFILIYLACNHYKMNLNSGFISFGQCLKIGVSLCVVAGLIYALFSAAFAMVFPEYFDEIFRKMQSVMLKDNPQLTQEQMDMSISMMKKFSSPVFAIPLTVVMFAFIGLIHSLIVGAIVKKDANQSF